MGLSRDTFYRYQKAVEGGGVEALLEPDRRRPNHKNRAEPEIEAAVVSYTIEFPAHGQARASNEQRKRGIFISPTGGYSVWLRHDLTNFRIRLKALEAKMAANEGLILTDAQVQAQEKKKLDEENHGGNLDCSSGLSGLAGHVLRGHPQGHGTVLPADLCGHLLEGRPLQAVHDQGAHHGGRPAQ
jgi:hypothetical protein